MLEVGSYWKAKYLTKKSIVKIVESGKEGNTSYSENEKIYRVYDVINNKVFELGECELSNEYFNIPREFVYLDVDCVLEKKNGNGFIVIRGHDYKEDKCIISNELLEKYKYAFIKIYNGYKMTIEMGLNTSPDFVKADMLIGKFAEEEGGQTMVDYWTKVKYRTLELKDRIEFCVEKFGMVSLNWSCHGETRFTMHSYEWAEALPQFYFETGRYICRVYKSEDYFKEVKKEEA